MLSNKLYINIRKAVNRYEAEIWILTVRLLHKFKAAQRSMTRAIHALAPNCESVVI